MDSWATKSNIGNDDGLEIRLLAQLYLIEHEETQVLISTLDRRSGTGFAVVLRRTRLEIWIGIGQAEVHVVPIVFPLNRWRWLDICLNVKGSSLSYQVQQIHRVAEPAPAPEATSLSLPRSYVHGQHPLTIAATLVEGGGNAPSHAADFFNGRIENPVIRRTGASEQTLAAYDFSQEMSSNNVIDTSGNGHHGVLLNAPMRAAKGHDWNGSVVDWAQNSSHYGAIHFHEDDLDDARWETSFCLRIPGSCRSGAYAIELEAQDQDLKDLAVFFVRPAPTSVARVAMVMPTFTYLAYANEHMFDQNKASAMVTPDGNPVKHRGDDFERMVARSDLGLSVYDVHVDGSGCTYSSSRRPILNIRPNYTHWALARPREFSADLMMIGFLEKLGVQYDVITDHCLHFSGSGVTSRYGTLITGGHPEYCSLQILDAYSHHAKSTNKNIMFLGGNGFYWVTSTNDSDPHRVEVRKGDQGCRSITIAPGERVHSTDGAAGGLWRSRGRAPNYIFGIGPCAFGTGPGKAFVRNPTTANHPIAAEVYKGIGPEDLIGVEGFGGGASGDEIDRLDFELGSPANTVLLASSQRHDDTFGLFNEESMWPMTDTLGSNCDKVRSDMTYYKTAGGGGVFAVGSINWYSSLGWNSYENNVARVTENVLSMFTKQPG